MVKIITDSTADLPQTIIEQYKFGMIPLQVSIDGQDYIDKVNITINELYDHIRNGRTPKTSQPNPLQVFDILSKEVELGHDIIVITLSSKLSGTYQSLYLISQSIKEKYPHIKLEIIDSLGGSGVSGLMAIQAGKMVERNHSFEEIVQVLHEMALSSEHIFTLNNLKSLINSGRINKVGSLLGNMLHIKPILQVVNGEIQLHSVTRGINKSLTKIVDQVEQKMQHFQNQTIAVMHADDIDTANHLCNLLVERLGNVPMIVDQIGSVLGSHLGIGGVGVFFFTQKPSIYYL